MSKRYLFPLLALILALSLAAPHAPARAQDGSEPVCNGLSDEDCQVILDAQQQMQEVRLFSVPSWSVNLDLTADGDPTHLSASGALTVIPPQSLVALLSDLGMANQQEMMQNLLDQIDSAAIQQWLSEIVLDATLTDLSYSSGSDSGSFSGELIVKDSGVYVQLPSPTGAVTWFGQVIKPEDLGDLDAQLDELRQQFSNPETMPQMQGMMELGIDTAQFTDLANRYITTTRGADHDGMSVFTTTFDLPGFLNDPEVGTMLADLMNSPAMAQMNEGSQTQVTAAQVQLLMQAVKLMIGESTISSTMWISDADGYIHHVGVDLALTLNPSEVTGEASGPFVLSFQAAVDLDNFNDVSPDSVTPPEEYFSLDETNAYYPGTADMIAAQLEPGQTFSGTFEGTESDDIYSVDLDAGSTIEIEVTPSGSASVQVIGPDGFEVLWAHGDGPSAFTAEQGGQHLIVLKNLFGGDYELTVRPQ